jgi:prolyl-tRNA editing enzyme YbaK/EbsC (Cys-tRNA(Pro) deacylase)
MLDDAARTAQQAADALGVRLGQIAKSIIFRRKSDEAAVLVVTSGDRRVDERRSRPGLSGRQARGPRRRRIRQNQTGFSIGGVSPVAHITAGVLMDLSLMRFEESGPRPAIRMRCSS